MAKCKNCKHLKIDSSIEKKICFLIGEIGNPDEEISCCCYRPATNADRIRSMTDVELAEFLLKVNTAYAEPCMTGENDCVWEDYPTHDKGCKDCFLEWLKSEVEV